MFCVNMTEKEDIFLSWFADITKIVKIHFPFDEVKQFSVCTAITNTWVNPQTSGALTPDFTCLFLAEYSFNKIPNPQQEQEVS